MPCKIHGLLLMADVETNLKIFISRLNRKVGDFARDGPPILISHRHINPAYDFSSADPHMTQVAICEMSRHGTGFECADFPGGLSRPCQISNAVKRLIATPTIRLAG